MTAPRITHTPTAPSDDTDVLVALVGKAWAEHRVDELLSTIQQTLHRLHAEYLADLNNHSRTPAA